eukprot:4239447-Alexandrium_andersonii.AAC.1
MPRGVRQAHPTCSDAQQQHRRGACALWAAVRGPAGPCSPPPTILDTCAAAVNDWACSRMRRSVPSVGHHLRSRDFCENQRRA